MNTLYDTMHICHDNIEGKQLKKLVANMNIRLWRNLKILRQNAQSSARNLKQMFPAENMAEPSTQFKKSKR
jgi:hypothetical protein